MESAASLARLVVTDDPGQGLHAAAALGRLAERLELLHVQRARAQGWSWQQIGEALGTSRQAAHRKYAGLGERED